MSEKKIKVGDLVVLSERGKTLFGELSYSDMPMRITNGKDGIYWCLLKDGKKIMYLNASHIEPFHNEDNCMPISCKETEFAKLTKQMLETFKKKNADYGDSTSQTFKEFGLTSYAIRLNDKLNRIKSFCKKGELEVSNESVIDTLKDISVYSVLAIIDIENRSNETKRE